MPFKWLPKAQWLLAKGFTAGLTKPVRSSQLLELIHSVVGLNGYLVKPLDGNAVLSAIENALASTRN